MRRHAELETMFEGGGFRAPGEIEKAIERVRKPALSVRRRRAAEAGRAVEHRQQCQADAGCACGGDDALRQFGRIVIGLSVRGVMQVMEFRDAGKAGFQHFDKSEGGDRLDVVGRQQPEKVVHDLAPCPEIVFAVAAALGETRHSALERMRMKIGQAR